MFAAKQSLAASVFKPLFLILKLTLTSLTALFTAVQLENGLEILIAQRRRYNIKTFLLKSFPGITLVLDMDPGASSYSHNSSMAI